MALTELYMSIGITIGLYIGLLIGMCIPLAHYRVVDRRIRGHYRDLTNNDKIKVIDLLNEMSDNHRILSTMIPLATFKRQRNNIHKLIYDMNKLFTD